jgi:hypothetical protein
VAARCFELVAGGVGLGSGLEFFVHPVDAESHEGPGREQVTFGFADQAAMTATRVEGQLADDRERVLVAGYLSVGEGADRVEVSWSRTSRQVIWPSSRTGMT